MTPYQIENTFYACGTPVVVAENEAGETHVYHARTGEQLSTSSLRFGRVFGGGKDLTLESTSVRMESGFLYLLSGGGEGGSAAQTEVTLEGGMIGGYLYGGGVNDRVGAARLHVSGGAVKWGVFGAGESLSCDRVRMTCPCLISTNVTTGTRNPEGCCGDAEMELDDGAILSLNCGGKGRTSGSVELTLRGGALEKEITDWGVEGGIRIHLYENAYTTNGLDKTFPALPEKAEVDTLPPIERNPLPRQKLRSDRFLDTSDDAGKLVFRFFEQRHPAVPRYETPYPPFIGDCIFIRFPSGQTMLVDTGLPHAAEELENGLRALGVQTLDYLLITHHHVDHMGNAARILRTFGAREIILPAAMVPIKGESVEPYTALVHEINVRKIPLRFVSRGDRLTVGGEQLKTDILFLNPAYPGAVCEELNSQSIAMKLTFGQSSAVLGGDITDQTEADLAHQYGEELACDLLKLSHHGIVYQTHCDYIDACAPDVIVVQSLRPHGVFWKTTGHALRTVHHYDPSRLFITGLHGAIRATLDGTRHGVSIETQYE